MTALALAPAGCKICPQPPVRVGANIWPGYECLFIARSLRLFQNQAVKLVEYPTTPEVVRAFKNRAIELAALTSDEFIRLAAEEPDLCAILVMDVSNGADVVIGRAEHHSLADLRGKRIGVEVNALGVYMLTRALASVGLRREDVQPVAIECDQHVAAFREGKVDAVVSFEPYRGKLLKEGGCVLFDSAKISGEVMDLLVGHKALLRERGETVRGIVDGWFKARERLFDQGTEVARLVAAREGMSPEEFIDTLDLIDLPSIDRNRELLAQGGPALTRLQNTHQIMLEHGLVRGNFPSHGLLDGGFLP